jgi:hypothetical protein
VAAKRKRTARGKLTPNERVEKCLLDHGLVKAPITLTELYVEVPAFAALVSAVQAGVKSPLINFIADIACQELKKRATASP